MIYQNSQIASILLLTGATATPSISNDYVQLGFLGILLTILIWYSKRSYTEGIRRDKAAEVEKKEIIERYEEKLDAAQEHHERQLDAANARYHEVHMEIMAYLRASNTLKKETS